MSNIYIRDKISKRVDREQETSSIRTDKLVPIVLSAYHSIITALIQMNPKMNRVLFSTKTLRIVTYTIIPLVLYRYFLGSSSYLKVREQITAQNFKKTTAYTSIHSLENININSSLYSPIYLVSPEAFVSLKSIEGKITLFDQELRKYWSYYECYQPNQTLLIENLQDREFTERIFANLSSESPNGSVCGCIRNPSRRIRKKISCKSKNCKIINPMSPLWILLIGDSTFRHLFKHFAYVIAAIGFKYKISDLKCERMLTNETFNDFTRQAKQSEFDRSFEFGKFRLSEFMKIWDEICHLDAALFQKTTNYRHS